METISITSEDIRKAEIILNIPVGFDQQRRDIIECMESRDIVACPGSGKTTVLLAKLIILASKMPFDNNKGICVLTHTNVAIDEIKNKLGDKANILLSYPNYVGTIQSFVDRYLAIPACIKAFGIRPTRVIEDDEFKWRLIQKFHSMYSNPKNSKLSRFLYGKVEKKIRDSGNWNKINKAKDEILCSLRMDYVTGTIKRNIMNNEIIALKTPDAPSYQEYRKLIFSLIKDGFLSFNEAYGMAFKYLTAFQDLIKPIILERFPYVFVDEMQDTNTTQMALFDKMFDKDKIVYQCFGDPEQAIYDYSSKQETAWTPSNYLSITNSKRFSNNIAKVTDCVAVNPHNMSGMDDFGIPPIVITYLNNDVTTVLPIFARTIIHYNLQTLTDPIFKAVGMVKYHEKLGITDYFSNFDKVKSKVNFNRDFPCLSMYLTKLSDDILNKQGTKAYYNRFINAILKVLRLADIKASDGKYFSKTTFIKCLKETDERFYNGMYRIFARCILFVEADKNILSYFKRLLVILLKHLGQEPNLDVLSFFDNTAALDINTSLSEKQCNVYEFEGIQIEVDTVHGVKGQTHLATLYMETFNNKYVTENIVEYLIDGPKKSNTSTVERHLKIAYVALTRPQKLLCITMKDEIYEQYKEALNSKGWVKYDEILRNDSAPAV